MTGRSKCKRKRSKKSKNSSSSSTDSEATPKRIKEAPSMSTASVGEDSVFVYSPVSEPPTTLPSDPLNSANMADQVEMTETEIPSRPTPHAHPPPPSIEDIGTLLDNKLGLFRLDLLNHRSITSKFVTPTAPSCIDNSWRSTTLPAADSASSNQTLPFQNEHEWVLEKLR